MTSEELDGQISQLVAQSVAVGARAMFAYLLRMRMLDHERRMDFVRGKGQAMIHNRIVSAEKDIRQFEGKLQVALDSLLDDLKDDDNGLAAMEEIYREVCEGKDNFKNHLEERVWTLDS